MYVIRIIVLKETYCCNSNLKVNIAAKMVMPKVTTLFDVTGCELVKKKTVADLVPDDSYAVLILYFTYCQNETSVSWKNSVFLLQ